jgi:hypothetical protein
LEWKASLPIRLSFSGTSVPALPLSHTYLSHLISDFLYLHDLVFEGYREYQ